MRANQKNEPRNLPLSRPIANIRYGRRRKSAGKLPEIIVPLSVQTLIPAGFENGKAFPNRIPKAAGFSTIPVSACVFAPYSGEYLSKAISTRPCPFLFHAKNLLLLRPLCEKNNDRFIIIIAQIAANWEVFLFSFSLVRPDADSGLFPPSATVKGRLYEIWLTFRGKWTASPARVGRANHCKAWEYCVPVRNGTRRR